MSWDGETNPHFFWTRDRPQAPPQPPSDQPGPSQQQPGPSRQQPGRKIRARERPDRVRLPPPVEPVVSQPTPRTQHPEYERKPADHGPEVVLPTSKDHWPMHRHEASEDHWPIGLHHTGQEGPPRPHHPRPTMQQPHFGPTTGRPHPMRQQQPDHDHDGMTTGRPHPKKQQQPDHDHDGMTSGLPPPRQQQPPRKEQQPPGKQQPHVGSTTGVPPRRQTPPAAQPDHGRRRRDDTLIYPSPHRTNAFTWFIAIFCVILWVAIILGGILILIIYLAYRPRNPHFEISDASLNAAYLDMGYLLNADLTLLVNFTNMNQKMSVDFNFIVLKLRYENHMIANQYIEPFSAGKLEKKFARVEMVSSQIRLPVLVTQQLIRQIQDNRITFEIDGYFHARSRLGSIFRYSYWLYSHCTIVTKGPPSGVMVVSKCITKR